MFKVCQRFKRYENRGCMFIENIDATLFPENRSWYSLPHPKKGISTLLTLTFFVRGFSKGEKT